MKETIRTNSVHNQSALAVDMIMKSALVRKSLDNVTCLFIGLHNFEVAVDEASGKKRSNVEINMPPERLMTEPSAYCLTDPGIDTATPKLRAASRGLKNDELNRKIQPRPSQFGGDYFTPEKDEYKSTLNRFKVDAKKINKIGGINSANNHLKKMTSFELKKKLTNSSFKRQATSKGKT